MINSQILLFPLKYISFSQLSRLLLFSVVNLVNTSNFHLHQYKSINLIDNLNEHINLDSMETLSLLMKLKEEIYDIKNFDHTIDFFSSEDIELFQFQSLLDLVLFTNFKIHITEKSDSKMTFFLTANSLLETVKAFN